MAVSFITCLKLMPGYETFAFRLKLYIENVALGCRTFGVPFEIIVVEERDAKNVAFVSLSEAFLVEHNARLVEYAPTYANPHGYNIVEAYAKNVGLAQAKHEYACITNCDVLFNAAFFEHLLGLKPRVLYRFLENETSAVDDWAKLTLAEALQLGAAGTCINAQLMDKSKWTVRGIAYKAGDAMLVDTATWRLIKGFPENNVWIHSDLIVVIVLNNNGVSLDVPAAPRVYTSPHERAFAEQPFELKKALEYESKKACN
jgi:hypothetical protein